MLPPAVGKTDGVDGCVDTLGFVFDDIVVVVLSGSEVVCMELVLVFPAVVWCVAVDISLAVRVVVLGVIIFLRVDA